MDKKEKKIMIAKINLHLLEKYNDLDDLTFIHPIGSKLHRVCSIPERYRKSDKFCEIIQVLNTLCTRYYDGIFYFRFADDEAFMDVIESFEHMDVDVVIVTEDRYGKDAYGYPIAEMLN